MAPVAIRVQPRKKVFATFLIFSVIACVSHWMVSECNIRQRETQNIFFLNFVYLMKWIIKHPFYPRHGTVCYVQYYRFISVTQQIYLQHGKHTKGAVLQVYMASSYPYVWVIWLFFAGRITCCGYWSHFLFLFGGHSFIYKIHICTFFHIYHTSSSSTSLPGGGVFANCQGLAHIEGVRWWHMGAHNASDRLFFCPRMEHMW